MYVSSADSGGGNMDATQMSEDWLDNEWSIYDRNVLHEKLSADEISPYEEGFLRGYLDDVDRSMDGVI